MKGKLNWLKRALTPTGSITRQSLASGVWLSAMNVMARGLQIAMLIILARLLSPHEFGVVGIAILVITGLTRFSKLGLNDALIYNKDEDVNRYLNTAWVLSVGRGVALAALLVGTAPYVAGFFGEPDVALVLPVLAIGPLLDNARNPGIVYFKKDLNYHKTFAYQISAALMQFVLAVGYALYDPSVWALVIGYLSTSGTRFVMSFILHGYRPFPAFDVERARELIDYGKWITGASITGFLRTEGDDFFVGWLLGATSVGFYQLAYRLSNAPATEITHVISDVTFPAYSKVQDDLGALRTGFFRAMHLSMFVASPMAIGIAIVAPTFTRAFVGEQWLPMVLPMQILAGYGLARAYAASFGSVWRAIGRPDYLTKLQGLQVVLMAVLIWPATAAYGIVGTSLVIFGVSVTVMVTLDTYVTVKALETSYRRVASEIAYPLIAASLMGAVVYMANGALDVGSPLLKFVLLVVVGAAAYISAVLVLELQFNWGLRAEIREVRGNL